MMAATTTTTSKAQALRKHTPYVPEGREKPRVRPAAVLRAGDMLSPGDIQLHDLLCLPKAFAEIVQVIGVTKPGTEDESFNCRVLPGPAEGGKKPALLVLTLAQLNGPKDQTGEQRPIAILRVGQALTGATRTAVMLPPEGVVVFQPINKRGPRAYGGGNVGVPLNQALYLLKASLPDEAGATLAPVER